jgi:uncharacterized DUF497 family protein
MRFEWDPRKARINKLKHGVTFEEAASCFDDEHGRFYEDREHHDRFVLIALSSRQRLLFCVHAELAGDRIRIVSARLASKPERRRYEEED